MCLQASLRVMKAIKRASGRRWGSLRSGLKHGERDPFGLEKLCGTNGMSLGDMGGKHIVS